MRPAISAWRGARSSASTYWVRAVVRSPRTSASSGSTRRLAISRARRAASVGTSASAPCAAWSTQVLPSAPRDCHRTPSVDGTRAPAVGKSARRGVALLLAGRRSVKIMAPVPALGEWPSPSSASTHAIAIAVAGAGRPAPRAFATTSTRSSPSASAWTSKATTGASLEGDPGDRSAPAAGAGSSASFVAATQTVDLARPTSIHTSGARVPTSPRSLGAAHRSRSRAPISSRSTCNAPRRCRKRATPPETSTGKRVPGRPVESSTTRRHENSIGSASSRPIPSRPIARRRRGRSDKGALAGDGREGGRGSAVPAPPPPRGARGRAGPAPGNRPPSRRPGEAAHALRGNGGCGLVGMLRGGCPAAEGGAEGAEGAEGAGSVAGLAGLDRTNAVLSGRLVGDFATFGVSCGVAAWLDRRRLACENPG